MNKKSNYDIYKIVEQVEETKICDEVNCNQEALYSAPKSPGSKEKYTFCLKHIKAYNKRWNFFAGRSQKEIYDFYKNDFFDGRPTKPFSEGNFSHIKFNFTYKINKNSFKFTKENNSRFNNEKKIVSKEINKSLKVLGLELESSKKVLKKRYKELVKKFHPDINKTLSDKEKKIKEINKAYQVLLEYYRI